jgi:hypothetical protein
VATLVARNANEAVVVLMVGSGDICIWRNSGVWSQAVVLCWCFWQETGFSRHEDGFTLNLLKKTFYKSCTFNLNCKNIHAVNFIIAQHKKIIPTKV